MLNLVFYNSYQNSYVGFQASQYLIGSKKLNIENGKHSLFPETEKLLSNSGCLCAVGKSKNGNNNYFVYRGLQIHGEDSIDWYINLGIETDEESSNQFYTVVTNILLDFELFRNDLEKWFITTPEKSFSYDLNYDYIEQYFSTGKKTSFEEIEFYQLSNRYIEKFKNMISDIKTSPSNSMILLVPETTLNYFVKQNPFFENIEKRCVISPTIFNGLLEHDKTTIMLQHAETNDSSTLKKNQNTNQKNDDPIGEFFNDNKHTIELMGKIAIGTLAVVGAGILIKKVLF